MATPHPSPFLHQPPFSGLSPHSSKKFHTLPKWLNFWEVLPPYPPPTMPCDLLQILNCECDLLFNCKAIKLVTYTVCMCLDRSWYTVWYVRNTKRSNYLANCWLITKIMWLTGNYNLPLIISLDFLYIEWVIRLYLWALQCVHQHAEDMNLL